MASTAFGYTMQATSAAWLMATLSPSPLMVALVQTASTLPSLLFALVAGGMADIVDRRRMLLVTHSLLFVAAATLALATYAHLIGPSSLLLLVFLTGLGFTFSMPAQQAMLGDLVPHAELMAAVNLGSVAANASRAIAPAVAGTIATFIGTGSVFLTSAVSLGGMVYAVWSIRLTPHGRPALAEQLFSSIQSGLRFARHSPPTRAFIVRTFIFCLFGSSLFALLPIVARDNLGLGAGGFGLLFGSFGAGAVIGAFSLTRLLPELSLNTRVNGAIVLFGSAITLLGNTTMLAVAIGASLFAGLAWVSILSGLFSGALSWSPSWVRARVVATNLLVLQAGLATGSLLWGWLASASHIGTALTASAVGLLLTTILTRNVRVSYGQERDVSTRVSMPDLIIAIEPHPRDGPVLIQCEYSIARENCAAFLSTVAALEPVRRRNGAENWQVFRDLGNDSCFYERFVVASWGEYTRLRTRMTVVDQELQERVVALQLPGVPIRISRLIAVNADFAASWEASAQGE